MNIANVSKISIAKLSIYLQPLIVLERLVLHVYDFLGMFVLKV